MYNLINRIKLVKNSSINNGNIVIASNAKLRVSNTSKIEINDGFFKFGYPLDINSPFPSYKNSLIKMGKNSKLIIKGNVSVSHGSSIVICDNGVLEFDGNNIFAHNTFIYCYKNIKFGKFVSSSWNCTFMDWDGHLFEREDKINKNFYRPLVLKAGVGIQMNVVIPRGVEVGENSVLSANTVLRSDIAPNTLVYSIAELRMKNGIKSGLIKA